MDSSVLSLTEIASRATDYAEQQGALLQRLGSYHPVNDNDDTIPFSTAVNKYLLPEGKANLSDDVAGC